MYNFFLLLAIPSSIIFLVLIALSFLGFGETDLDTDMETDTELESDFPYLTLRNLISFLTMFSWTGMACSKFGISLIPTLFISVVSGLILVFILISIYAIMDKLKQNTDSSMESAIGKTATVYLKIGSSGLGQVNVIINGLLKTVNAISENGDEIDTNESVTVVGVSGDKLVVRK